MATMTPRRREAPPKVWRLFAREWLGLSVSQATRWWQALRRATSPRAVQLRSAVLCQAVLPQTRAALEHLARQESNALQGKVLSKTDREGQWKGDPHGDRAL
jgi:hypothetical protein